MPYALLAQDLNPDGGLVPPATVPFGLPFTQVPNPLAIFSPVDDQTLPPTISQDWANDFKTASSRRGSSFSSCSMVRAARRLRSTSDLIILNGPDQFAINMQDMADGLSLHGDARPSRRPIVRLLGLRHHDHGGDGNR